jgi:hypothetical protein
MALVLDGSNGITFPNASTQNTGVANTSAILSLIGPKGLATPYLGTGAVSQVVQIFDTSNASYSSGTWANITSNLALTITPSSSTSKILLIATLHTEMSSSNLGAMRFTRNGSAIATSPTGTTTPYPSGKVYLSQGYGGINGTQIPMMYLDSPATSSAVTYQIQWAVQAGTTYYNQGVSSNWFDTSTFMALEIA